MRYMTKKVVSTEKNKINSDIEPVSVLLDDPLMHYNSMLSLEVTVSLSQPSSRLL